MSTIALKSSGGERTLPRYRMLAAEKHEEQHAERIDIGRGRHRIAEHLFRGGELRRQRATSFAGELGCLARSSLVLEQLGDAEVEQLHRAVAP